MPWIARHVLLGVVGLVGFSAAVLGLVAQPPRARRAVHLALASGVLAFVLGSGGSVVALMSSFHSVAAVQPEHKAAVLAAGIDGSMRSAWVGTIEFVLIFPLAIAGAVRGAIRK